MEPKSRNLPNVMKALVPNTPGLRSLRMDSLSLAGWDEVFVNMGQLRHLDSLGLVRCCHVPLNALSTLLTESESLRRLEYGDMSLLETNLPAVIEALVGGQPQNTRTETSSLNDDACSGGCKMSTVEELCIGAKEAITRQMLVPLVILPRLKTLELMLDVDICRDCMFEYLREWPREIEVHIMNGWNHNLPAGRYIRGKDGALSFIPTQRKYT